MGIKGLTKFLADQASKCIRPLNVQSLMGRVVAVDASMSLYQFLIAIRSQEDPLSALTNEAGETTSHLSGMLARAIRLLELGIKPIYIFEGKAPEMKEQELVRRGQRRQEAEIELAHAQEKGDAEAVRKQVGRTIRVTSQHNEDIKTLLTLIGIPICDAPGEAEAQCAELVKNGKAYATATEDADALTFGTSILIRNLQFSESRSKTHPTFSITLQVALKELGLTMDQFIDLCILCGCDYCDTIRGIGAKTAYNLIKENKSLEGIFELYKERDVTDDKENGSSKKKTFSISPKLAEQLLNARKLFISPKVAPASEFNFTWGEVNTDGLIDFLVNKNNFDRTRVDNCIARLKKAKSKTSQLRLENYFGSTTVKSSTLCSKRQEKEDELKNKKKVKKQKIV